MGWRNEKCHLCTANVQFLEFLLGKKLGRVPVFTGAPGGRLKSPLPLCEHCYLFFGCGYAALGPLRLSGEIIFFMAFLGSLEKVILQHLANSRKPSP